MKANLKTSWMATASALAVMFGVSFSADAAPLPPGLFLFPAPAEAEPVGGSVLDTVIAPWGTSFSFSGVLTSKVVSGDASNPLGGLTFVYEFSIDGTSSHEASQLSIGGFVDSLADASYDGGSAGVSPLFISRSDEGSGFGTNIRFGFSPGVTPGSSSKILVVQTDASTYDHSIASMINSSAYPNIPTLAPSMVPIPEPATVGLFLVGLASLMGIRRFGRD